MTLYERSLAVLAPVAKRATTLGVVDAQGSYIYTEDGKKVLDFASGVAVNNLGHKHPRIVRAIEKQLETMIHVGHNVVYNESYVALAEKLVEKTDGDTMVYFSNSGAEANEGAIKLAKYVTKRPAIISFQNSFHGRTMACVSVTGSSAAYRKNYEPLLPGIYWAEYANCYECPFHEKAGECQMGCLKQFDSIFHKLVDPSMVAAMIVEPVQGEGGYVTPPATFLKGLREICDKHGILLIFDEIQTGVGRTGALYAYQKFGVKPDILTTAKALGGGIPLSAVIGKKEFMQQWTPGAHGGTFGGNPLACAAALETLTVIEEEHLIDNCNEMGAYFLSLLEQLQNKYPKVIGNVRGIGLMIGLELADENHAPMAQMAAQIKEQTLMDGLLLLLCGTNHNVIRFIAPLNVSKEEIDTAYQILEQAFAKVVGI